VRLEARSESTSEKEKTYPYNTYYSPLSVTSFGEPVELLGVVQAQHPEKLH
jgi:hypothetical protein